MRDIYDLGDRLLLIATDRISAFDWVLPTGIPDKGRVLTGLSMFWYQKLEIPNHYLSGAEDAGLALPRNVLDKFAGRAMVVKKAQVVPFECVVRGYLSGSGWKEYQSGGAVCGEELPPGLLESGKIEPIFTPATKAESGHDENVSLDFMANQIGTELTSRLRDSSIALYNKAADYASSRGLVLADTKFEWGLEVGTGGLLLIDEVLTPDSSRYWDAATYLPGGPQPSFDKQFVRDWLESSGWDKASPPPELPSDVVSKTRNKYIKAYEILTGLDFPYR